MCLNPSLTIHLLLLFFRLSTLLEDMSTSVQDSRQLHKSPESGPVDDLQSLTWRGISESNIIILNRLIKEIVQNDKPPPQLLEAANTILETLSHLKVTVIRFYPPTHVTNLFFFFSDATEPERGFRETPSRRFRLSRRHLAIIQSKVPINLATPQFGQGYRKTRKVCRPSI